MDKKRKIRAEITFNQDLTQFNVLTNVEIESYGNSLPDFDGWDHDEAKKIYDKKLKSIEDYFGVEIIGYSIEDEGEGHTIDRSKK